MAVWIAVVATGLGCYALKLTGLVAPQRVLDDERVRRFPHVGRRNDQGMQINFYDLRTRGKSCGDMANLVDYLHHEP